MTVRSRAPVRIDFAGGTTDLSPFRDREGGAVLNATITRYAYCTLRSLPNGHVRISSEDLQKFVEAQHIRELEFDGNLDLLKAAVKALDIAGGFDITVRCDAPPGSGTGSSASVGVALIGMLDLLRDADRPRRLSKYQIADLASELESDLGIVGGKQDQYAAALGGINFIRFFGEGRVSVERLSLPPELLYEL
ncbi:MAG: GHMP kinase, partial [Armatimonadota bacterium]